MKTFATTIALASAAAASSIGSAHVVNKCSYDVTLCNVPSAGGGYEQQEMSLKSGESWNQTWTELTNGNGWSIKLSKDDQIIGGNILQYEYTFHNDGIIWYDLSCVDGNPWDQDWEITATGDSCSPKQQAYRYSTDDAYGMQSCGQDASITVTLCTGLSADNGSAVDAPDAPTYESTPSVAVVNNKGAAAVAATTPTPTTFATLTTTPVVISVGPFAVTVTEVVTAYETNIVTAYERRHLRYEHGHHHRA